MIQHAPPPSETKSQELAAISQANFAPKGNFSPQIGWANRVTSQLANDRYGNITRRS